MIMKSKLNLGQLKVESFVTELDTKNANTAKGGVWTIDATPCAETMIVDLCNWTFPPVCCVTTAPR